MTIMISWARNNWTTPLRALFASFLCFGLTDKNAAVEAFPSCSLLLRRHPSVLVSTSCTTTTTPPPRITSTSHGLGAAISVTNEDLALASWVLAFSSSHIGMSAVRIKLIHAFGAWADGSLGLVGRPNWQLPDYWPGDEVGQRQLFPDRETTGRQLYRAFYTAISFGTLGKAAEAYVAATTRTTTTGIMEPPIPSFPPEMLLAAHAVASICFGISIASLFNPSPLSLVPGFVVQDTSDTATGTYSTTTSTAACNADAAAEGGANDSDGQRLPLLLGLERSDSLKLEPRGMTRISRHPLILPVIPWGIATAVLAGGRLPDLILFGGLSIYAIAGCAAQDLRIMKEEGSVGTVFAPGSSTSQAGTSLQGFFASTSFVPFAAIVDGRQAWKDAWNEFPILAFVAGCIIGHFLQDAIVGLLG